MTLRDDDVPAAGVARVRKTSLDKDLRKIERLEDAVRSVSRNPALGIALLFLVVAGVLASSQIGARPVGNFLYTKRLHLFSWIRCNVEIYPLSANCQHLAWPEKGSRRAIWLEPGAAAARVREPQLARVLREFDRSATALLE